MSIRELQDLSDEELMDCLKNGQSDGLAVLFDRYEKLVLSIALKIVRDPGEAEDVTQTVFLDVFRAMEQFDPRKGSTKVWLMQYAYHRAFNCRQHLEGREFYRNTELEENLEVRPVTTKDWSTFYRFSPRYCYFRNGTSKATVAVQFDCATTKTTGSLRFAVAPDSGHQNSGHLFPNVQLIPALEP